MSAPHTSLIDLVSDLRKRGAHVTILDPNTIRLPTLWGTEAPLFIQWNAPAGVVVLSQPLDAKASPHDGQVAIRVCAINASLPALGFVYRGETGDVDFRCHVRLDEAGQVPHMALYRTFTYVIAQVRAHADRILARSASASTTADGWWVEA